MSPWVPVVVSSVMGLLGLGIQGLLLAYFLGRMKANQEGQALLVSTVQNFTDKAIAALLGRMDAIDEFATFSKADRAALGARLAAVERNTDGLGGLREQVVELRATFTAHQDRQTADISHLTRSLDGVQRQLGNIVMGTAGRVIELPGGPRDGG